jgi:hypothetical protein
MRLLAIALTGAAFALTLALAGPVMAQDRDAKPDRDSMSSMRDKPAVQHRVTRHHVTYSWGYKSEEEEHQATEDLNRQYRGVPKDDQR